MDIAVQTLLGSAGQLLREEYQQLRGVGGEVAQLRDDVATMKALLLMHSEADEGAVDHFIQEWMKQLRELAFDAEDCIDDYRLRIKSRASDGVLAWLKRLLGTLSPRRHLAGEIIALRARAAAIRERHVPYGVDRKALRRSVWASTSVSARDLFGAIDPDNHRFKCNVGNQADGLVDQILEAIDTEESTRFYFFVGPAGVGKTTLAIEVCQRLKARFDCQAMLSLSPEFDSHSSPADRNLFNRDGSCRTDWLFERPLHWRGNEEEANCHLEQLFKRVELKRYLLVIDNVWTAPALLAVLSAIPRNNYGSRIIVTTQSEALPKACSITGNARICYVQHLNKKDSERMFLSRAFCSMDVFQSKEPEGNLSMTKRLKLKASSLEGKVRQTGVNKILEICNGLPLAIACIAGGLAGYIAQEKEDKFEEACEVMSYVMDTIHPLDRMRHIITLTYNHLPNEVKGCMMYLSIFPRNYVINKDRLLCRWIAEGLVTENQGMSMQEVAECYFDELLGRNMIEPVSIGYDGRVELCKVHDMVLEVVMSKALENYFVAILGGQHKGMSQDRIRRLSIHGDGDSWPRAVDPQQILGISIEDMNMQRVRSLSIFQLQGHKLLDQLRKFALLRVLDLEGCKGVTNKHVWYACQLHLLKFLNLRGTDIDNVPLEIGKLEHLGTLDVRDTLLVTQLPQTVTNLQKLECLLISNRHKRDYMWRLPRGLQKMKALRQLTLAVIGNDIQVARELGELLQQLQDLDIYIDQPEEDTTAKEFPISLIKSYSLRRLNIEIRGDKWMNNLLNGPLYLPPLLRYLRISGDIKRHLHGLKELPLKELVEFVISGACLLDDLFGALCELPNLRSIWIQQAGNTGGVLLAHARHTFPSLVNLKVTSDADPDVIWFERGSMQKLETLEVRFADEKKVIDGINHLTDSVKEIKLTGKKHNPALNRALEELEAENKRRPAPSQFQIVVKYDC